ncbi:hypothetical protein C8Q80DRAFT_1124672 [Daedaleopsis nitida]|nr:hypothetical protein C8Q80DRAFT_1124668 [Daedaleopsis nitida]KAI0738499.1 hypothetical protein C8Q80DRAFT_1124672 [Daedaleopsis nitida]
MARPTGTTAQANGSSRREIDRRSQLRVSMNAALAEVSGVPDATMRWTLETYVTDIVVGCGVELLGFPPTYTFGNLSITATGLARINHLIALWESGVMHFSRVSDERRCAAAENPLLAAPSPLLADEESTGGRPDIKRRRNRWKTNPLGLPGRYKRKGPKSAAFVSQEVEAAVEAETQRERAEDPLADLSGDEDYQRFSDDSESSVAQLLYSAGATTDVHDPDVLQSTRGTAGTSGKCS